MGGEQAPLTAETSVTGILVLLNRATLADAGRFLPIRRARDPLVAAHDHLGWNGPDKCRRRRALTASKVITLPPSWVYPTLPLLLDPSRFDTFGSHARGGRLALVADADHTREEVTAGADLVGAARLDRSLLRAQ
jgi:hypothetical protein